MSILQIESLGGWKLITAGSSGVEALRAVRNPKLHLVILDLDLEELDGIHVLQEIRKSRTPTRVLVFTGKSTRKDIQTALALKPSAFVHKSEPLAVFRSAIEAMWRGYSFLSPYATEVQEQHWHYSESTGHDLKIRELAVLKMVAEGSTNKRIAAALGLSPRSVEYHRKRMMRKLGLKSVLEVRDYALQKKLVQERE